MYYIDSIISPIKRAEFDSYRVLHTVLRGRRYYSSALNVPVLTEDRSDDSNNSFRAELDQVSFTSHTSPVKVGTHL